MTSRVGVTTRLEADRFGLTCRSTYCRPYAHILVDIGLFTNRLEMKYKR